MSADPDDPAIARELAAPVAIARELAGPAAIARQWAGQAEAGLEPVEREAAARVVAAEAEGAAAEAGAGHSRTRPAAISPEGGVDLSGRGCEEPAALNAVIYLHGHAR